MMTKLQLLPSSLLPRLLLRLLALSVLAYAALQLYFFASIGLMRWLAPPSSAFERSAIYQIATAKALSWPFAWRQDWVPYDQISTHLKRAVIASEDAAFTDHDGVDWNAIERAYDKNKKAEQLAQKNASSVKPPPAKASMAKGQTSAQTAKALSLKPIPVKTVGGSTITQQLAKNLFLSGERTYLRKVQEIILVVMLEGLLDKERIFEIYLNHVEWGEGVFGAGAAAQHYFKKSAAHLTVQESALLAVMLPRPKYFERRITTSAYLQNQANVIAARMGSVDIP